METYGSVRNHCPCKVGRHVYTLRPSFWPRRVEVGTVLLLPNWDPLGLRRVQVTPTCRVNWNSFLGTSFSTTPTSSTTPLRTETHFSKGVEKITVKTLITITRDGGKNRSKRYENNFSSPTGFPVQSSDTERGGDYEKGTCKVR